MQNDAPKNYVCRLTNQTFSQPCTVTKCIAHMSNLNRSGVEARPVTNCSHIDFQLAGYTEELNYAVEEQGFVGFRDLNYLSSFFGINEHKLRDVYTNNIELLKRSIAVVWAVKQPNEAPKCSKCGFPLSGKRFVADSYSCVSASMCAERQEVIDKAAQPFIIAVKPEEVTTLYNVLWRSLNENFTPAISLPSEIQDSLLEAY